MKRLVAVAVLALLVIVPTATAAPPKPTAVTTPMTRDLDAAGFNINDVGSLTASGNITAQANIQTSGYFVGRQMVATDGTIVLEPPDTSVISITAGRFDPSVQGIPGVNSGSLYLRGYPTPELWMFVGPLSTDWRRVAPVP